MKKLVLLLVIFVACRATAQNYNITFSGTGASSSLSTVKVENLTKNTFLTLNGNDMLLLTAATGVNSIREDKGSELKIYPNPMTDKTALEIFPPAAGEAVISVSDMTGKQLIQFKSYLENQNQSFVLTGLKNGFYMVSVKGNSYHFSGKLLSNGRSDGSTKIERVNSLAVYEKEEKTDSKGIQATVNMAYSNGDRLRFTGTSGIYTTVKTDIPTGSKTVTFNFVTCTDADNNNYPIVEIGTQVWMAENLKTTKYLNGDLIGTTTPAALNITFETTPKYQWAYGGIETNAAIYGRLYTWFTATESRNVCPSGWHLPALSEYSTLFTYLGQNGYGYEGVAWKTAKSISANSGWNTSLTAGTPGNDQASNNASGFSALPAGYRSDYGWNSGIGIMTYWWCSTESGGFGDVSVLYHDQPGESVSNHNKKYGYSVRCLKN